MPAVRANRVFIPISAMQQLYKLLQSLILAPLEDAVGAIIGLSGPIRYHILKSRRELVPTAVDCTPEAG